MGQLAPPLGKHSVAIGSPDSNSSHHRGARPTQPFATTDSRQNSRVAGASCANAGSCRLHGHAASPPGPCVSFVGRAGRQRSHGTRHASHAVRAAGYRTGRMHHRAQPTVGLGNRHAAGPRRAACTGCIRAPHRTGPAAPAVTVVQARHPCRAAQLRLRHNASGPTRAAPTTSAISTAANGSSRMPWRK